MLRFFYPLFMLFAFVSIMGCHENDSQATNERQTLFRLLSSGQTGITFTNTIEENDTFNMVDFFYVYNGGGVAVGDINQDTLPDIFFTGNMVSDRLYLNKGPHGDGRHGNGRHGDGRHGNDPHEELSFQFEDITGVSGIDTPGWSTGVTMVDINSDGLLDIYVCRSGNYPAEQRKNKLFVNNGINEENGLPSFTESAESYGLADTSYSTQAAFFDYDKDGDLDMYLLNHTNEIRNPNLVRPLVADGSGPSNDRLYRNNGAIPGRAVPGRDHTFTDVTVEAGILYDGLGLGVSISDVNEDGWDDIFVTNDFIANDYLYINNQDGTFSEMSKSSFGHMSHFSMGNDVADFNNDGLVDIISLDMLPQDNYHRKKMSGPMNYNLFEYTLQEGYMPQYMRNTVQLNLGKIKDQQHKFAEIGQLLGVHATDWSWAPLLADFNNDGWKDLFISNGYLRDITDLDFINYTAGLNNNITSDSLDQILKEKARQMPSIRLPNFLFENQGALNFEDVSEQWGIDQPSLSNGAAYGDLDLDGDLDLVVNNINDQAFAYENQTNLVGENNYLNIQLHGDSLNPMAIGAKVAVYCQGMLQVSEQFVSRGYQSSVDYIMHFGLGASQVIDSLQVTWPDGKVSRITEAKVNQTLTIRKEDASLSSSPNRQPAPDQWFQNVTEKIGLDHQHTDPEYNDFSRQYLLPHKLSDQGPGIAVDDVNGDGLEDFFVGGAYGHSGYLFYQKKDGTFSKKPLVAQEKYEEDLGVLFFDYDNDDDPDLYIASGSNEHFEASAYYQDRLYNNDGKGNFTLTQNVLPELRFSSSCVKAADFDQDGDLDLFVGGRLIPLKYPLPPDSYLLVNEGGKFVDKTNELAPGLRKAGMVNDALWTDFDNDMDTDLIVVGEFMPIQFFSNTEGKLENVSHRTGLTYTAGWWNSINSGDFDQDGDMDYILGNLGQNTKYQVSSSEPMTIYATDLDQNGFVDPILTYYIDHQEYPVHSRDDLIRQVPALKKKFPDYERYAKAGISDILSQADKSRAYIAKAFQLASCYMENTGDGRFQMTELPRQAQFAPVYGILVRDFNQDGYLDVLLSGNDFGTEVVSGRYDASTGTVLIGDGQGGFSAVMSLKSGLMVEGDVKGAASIKMEDQLLCLFAVNSGSMKAYATDEMSKHEDFLAIPPDVFKVKIVYADGMERLEEFYYGASYLSQSSRYLQLSGQEKQLIFYDFNGSSTVIEP